MIALVVNVLFTVAFFHVIRSAQAKGRNVMVVAVVNYVVASPICFFLSYAQGNLNLSGETLFWGAVQGICLSAHTTCFARPCPSADWRFQQRFSVYPS